MKSQFISVASHEFRTPLAAAVGSLELLERHAAKLTDAKRGELLTRIQRSLGRLTTIMTDVLQLSRADSGRVKVKRMDVDLGRFVQDIIHEVEAGDREQHRFSFQSNGESTAVPVDTNLLNHIVSNLIGNAVRHSPPGTRVAVTLEIGEQGLRADGRGRGHRHPGGGSRADFRAVRARQQCRSDRGHRPRPQHRQALHLELMGGRTSRACCADGDEARPFGLNVPLLQLHRPNMHSSLTARILVIEDDSAIRATLVDMLLEFNGHTVIHAANGTDGVALARRQSPDVILTDVSMPDLDGFEADP